MKTECCATGLEKRMDKDFDDFLSTLDYEGLVQEVDDSFEKEREIAGEEPSMASAVISFCFALLRRYHDWVRS